MKCPHCSETLAEKKVRGHDTELDFCGSCSAAWFDRGELPVLLGRDLSSQVEVPENAIKLDQTLCPRCRAPLHMFAYPRTGRVIEGCSSCAGIWLDEGDLAEIRNLPPEENDREMAEGVDDTNGEDAPSDRPPTRAIRERVRYSEKYGLDFSKLLLQSGSCRIDQQIPNWAEQKLRLIAANSYRIRTIFGSTLGWVEEEGRGLREWIRRSVSRRDRRCDMSVTGCSGEIVMRFTREPGTLLVRWGEELLGTVRRRGVKIQDGWELLDARGGHFGSVRFSSRPAMETGSTSAMDWRFPIVAHDGKEWGVITKKWSGAWKESTTDSDDFRVDYGKASWTPEQRAVIFGSIFAIDFDLFEDDNPEDGHGSA